MTTPLVSVVMSVFDSARFLPEALESILNQSYRDFECIVIDDGSTDSSSSMLDSYQQQDSRLRVCHYEHAGLINSLNCGCALARGKYLARMDADDIAVNDRLARQIEFLELHPEIAVLGGAVEWIDANGKSVGIYPNPSQDYEIKAALLRGFCAYWHPTIVLRREVFASAGGYRTGLVGAEDYDLWLRIADRFQLANLPDVLVKYRIHANQVSMRKRKQQTLSKVAAQASATFRKSGKLDPLSGMEEITPATLAGLGVTEARLQNELATDYRHWIRTMCAAGEYKIALDAALEILGSDFSLTERWQIADLYLSAARLYWKDGKFAKGLFSAVQAILTRPVVAGRPVKMLLRRIGLTGTRSSADS